MRTFFFLFLEVFPVMFYLFFFVIMIAPKTMHIQKHKQARINLRVNIYHTSKNKSHSVRRKASNLQE